MSDIKLVYFEFRGRGEFIRLVLIAAGVPFEDVRIQRSEWGPNHKAEAPYGQVPYMIYKGKVYGQSLAIANFFAREYGLYGNSNLERLRIDEVVGLVEDARPKVREWRMETNGIKKAEIVQQLKDDNFPQLLGFLESLLIDGGGTGFFVANTVSLADLVVYDVLDTILGIDPDAIAAFPDLKKLRENVEAIPSIRKYLETRPKTEI